MGRIPDPPQHCTPARRLEIKSKMQEGLAAIKEKVLQEEDPSRGVLDDPIVTYTQVSGSDCLIELNLVPDIPYHGQSMLDIGLVVDSIDHLVYSISLRGVANVGMEIWEWEAHNVPSRLGILKLQIRGPLV